MSALSSISSLTPSSLTGSTVPATATANEPESIRNGNQTAKNAYSEGLAFEQVLVNELAQTMAATVPGLDGSSGSDDGLGGTSDSSSDSSSGLGAYSSLIPSALTQGLMGNGGTGMAMEIARDIDPALNYPAASTSAATSTSTASLAATAAGPSGGVAAAGTTTSTGAAQ